MLSDLLLERKTIETKAGPVVIRKLPLRFREWAALRLYELQDGRLKPRAYSDVLAVHVATISTSVVSWPWGEVNESSAKELATEAPEIAEVILKAIEEFNVGPNDDEKKS